MEEDTVYSAAEKGWKNFEGFAREILRRFYARFRLYIKDTAWSHDEGRDGDAVYIFAPAGADGQVSDLEIIVRLWVEVKLRGKGKPVNLHDAGSHLIRAVNEKVNKLVFVTNGTFAPETREQIGKYCLNRHISCAFIDGARLEELRLKTGVLAPPVEATVPVTTEPFAGSLDVLVRLSSDPMPRDLHSRGQVCSKPEAPVFLVLDVEVRGDLLLPSPPSVVPPAEVEFCALYQSSFSPPLIDGERFRVVYAVWGQPGVSFRPADFGIIFEGVPAQTVSLRPDNGRVTVGTRFLSPRALASQDVIAAPLRRALNGWLSSPHHAVYALEAPAGVGKTYVVQGLRRRWLGRHVREIWLDGGCHNDMWSVVTTLVGALFPLAALRSSGAGAEMLERWLTDAGVADVGAVKAVARQLTTNVGASPPSRPVCVDIISSLIRHASTQNPVVLVYEDLHKALPSTILMIRALLGRFAHEGGGNSFILLTTRPPEHVWRESQGSVLDSEAGPAAFSDPLDLLLAQLGQDGKLLLMERPDTAQARALLASSLPHVEAQLLERMIEEVGTTPFALKELMAYLSAIEVLEPAGDGAWHLISARALNYRPELDDYHNATRERLNLLSAKWQAIYPWLDDFLVAGALLGRDFQTAQALKAADAPAGGLPSAVLDLLFSADVAQPSTFFSAGREQLRFTHDLIRSAFLKKNSWAVYGRLAARLLQDARPETTPLMCCRLARNAGDIDGCRELAERGHSEACRSGLYWEALQFRLLGLWALDPARATQLFDEAELARFVAIDPALEIGPTDIRSAPSRDDVAAALFDCLDDLVSIGFGGGKAVDSLVNEAAMLVRYAGTVEKKARLDYYAGRFAFDADDFQRSLEHHAGAEAAYVDLNEPALLNRRSENLSRVFLCQRQLDLIEEARATLDLLEGFDAGGAPEHSARMLAYRGYLHLYYDLPLVPGYWERAAEIARAAGNQERFVHHAVGHAYALLLLNRVNEAAEVFEEIETVTAKVSKLQKMRVRLDLDLGALALTRQDWHDADTHLSDAVVGGLQLDTLRQVWRIEANLATLYEATGEADRCESYDRRAVSGILMRARAEESLGENAPWLRQRHVLPALNWALRSRVCARTSQPLLSRFSPTQQTEIERLADLTCEGRLTEIPNGLGWHCKTVAGRPRFILTE